MSCHYVECLTNKAGWKLFGLLSDSSWHSAVHPPHIHIKVPPHLLFYLLLGVEITGPLIPNKHPHTHTHDDCGHTQISVFLAWPCEISHLGLATALCRARVFTRGSTPITGWQTASPDQEMGGGGDWFSCWMCCSSLWQPKSPYWALSVLIGVLAFEMCAVIRPREPTA